MYVEMPLDQFYLGNQLHRKAFLAAQESIDELAAVSCFGEEGKKEKKKQYS